MFEDVQPEDPSSAAVLVVDDDRSTRLLLKKVLGQSGFAVDLAADGVEAMERLDAREYDAILLDLVMPKADGFHVIRHVDEKDASLLRKIIIITGYPKQAAVDGVYAILTKPLDLTAVLSATQACVQHS